MIVKIYKLDDNELLTELVKGTHFIGRGPIFQCNDKRVSRNHATIEVTSDRVTLTSMHINPCFHRAANSKTITIVTKDSNKPLNDGDNIAFLPEMFWFNIKIEQEVLTEDLKRPLSQTSDEKIPDKRVKIENETVETSIANPETVTEDIDSKVFQNVENTNTNDSSNSEVNEVETETKNKDSYTEEKVAIKEENSDFRCNSDLLVDDNNPSTSTANPDDKKPKPRRDKCWYQEKCYRKNPDHKRQFSHPGDSDYDSDPNDNRPTCSFGAACYRRHSQHRRDYKHPQGPPTQTTLKRLRKKVNRLNAAEDEDLNLSESEEDPFIADDDSDEYLEESDDADSDWEDSQNVDEDSENMARLVKEAKRFIKK